MRPRTRATLLLLFFVGTTGAALAESGGGSAPESLWVDRPIARLEIEGLGRTRPGVIRRELELKPGRVLDWSEMERDRLRLLDLGIFATVRLEPRRDSLAQRPVLRIAVQERPTLLALPILAYDAEDRFSYGAAASETNFRGRRESLHLFALWGGVRSLVFGYGTPWLLGKRLGFGLEAYGSRRRKRTEALMENRRGLTLRLSPGRGRRFRFHVQPGAEEVRTRPLDPDSPLAPPRERDDHRWLFLGATLETREYRARATSGGHFSLGSARHGGPLGGDTDFWRHQLDWLRVVRTGEESGLSLASRLVVSRGRVPRYQRLNLGGIETLRGYGQGEFAGESRWVGWIEQRVPLLPQRTFSIWKGRYRVDTTVDGVIFLDAGSIWEGHDLEDGRARAHFGGGLGLRVVAPLFQVLRLDVATDGQSVRVYGGGGMRL